MNTPADAMAIVDAHQHFWDPTRHYYPWLCDQPPIPFRYGDYAPIRRKYLPDDYRADAAPFVVQASVYVETEWDPRDPVGEMRYVQTLRRTYGLPTVAVAQAWLDRPDAAQVLAQQASFDFVRSVRHKPPPIEELNRTVPLTRPDPPRPRPCGYGRGLS